MEPIFTMRYGEFAVVDYLSKNIKDVSVFVPASAQNRGDGFLIHGKSRICPLHKSICDHFIK